MPQTFIPHVLRTTIIAITPDLTQQLNVFHTHKPVGPISSADCDTINDTVAAWITASYAACFSSQLLVQAVHTRSMEGLLVPQATKDLAINGGATGDCLPYATSLSVELNSGLTSRRNKGSFHVFTASEEDNQTNNHPSTAYVGVVQGALEDLISTLNIAGYPLIIASYRYSSFVEVTTAIASFKWGTVVSRKIGRGR